MKRRKPKLDHITRKQGDANVDLWTASQQLGSDSMPIAVAAVHRFEEAIDSLERAFAAEWDKLTIAQRTSYDGMRRYAIHHGTLLEAEQAARRERDRIWRNPAGKQALEKIAREREDRKRAKRVA